MSSRFPRLVSIFLVNVSCWVELSSSALLRDFSAMMFLKSGYPWNRLIKAHGCVILTLGFLSKTRYRPFHSAWSLKSRYGKPRVNKQLTLSPVSFPRKESVKVFRYERRTGSTIYLLRSDCGITQFEPNSSELVRLKTEFEIIFVESVPFDSTVLI